MRLFDVNKTSFWRILTSAILRKNIEKKLKKMQKKSEKNQKKKLPVDPTFPVAVVLPGPPAPPGTERQAEPAAPLPAEIPGVLPAPEPPA